MQLYMEHKLYIGIYYWTNRTATFVHICAKTQSTAIHTSYVIAKYVLETNMSTKLGIYANIW